ncbi:cell wall anchor protein [Chryseobacterium sp. B21-037]|uniref:cell wall anchor protein n=1 Tax=Chryseobacterium sp. B21-037 TaxID=2926038 RepID=UPI002359F2AC|nr:cell wall anchor protein [Chryseobacterium sp. B21-037]MDC8106356.1 cell wall anchor protein [Chryseobacterium sp. B21-037]
MKTKLVPLLIAVSSMAFAQSWNLTGNSGTNSSSNFIGTTDNQPLVFKTNNTKVMSILPNGVVKVGINDPGGSGEAYFRIYKEDNPAFEIANSLGSFQIGKSGCSGCWGGQIGDTVLRNLGQSHNIIIAQPNDGNDGSTYFGIQDAYNGTWVKFFNNAIARFDGKIKAKEVEVKANVWADYVFKKEYPLRSLEDVEKHIHEKGHLPNIPTAKEVLENGINVAEMNSKLLEKIEELTLYSIEQNKQIKHQAIQLKLLQDENEVLKIQSAKIEKLEQKVQELLSTQK